MGVFCFFCFLQNKKHNKKQSASVKYHPFNLTFLTPRWEHWQVGSLSGADASQRVTEACEGNLKLVGNQLESAMVKGCLTARPTSRAGTKVGHSDPGAPRGRALA